MGDVVEVSPSGRAKCRGCKESIAKGVVRFGESYDSAFTGGEALRYWHLECAAKKLPAQVEAALAGYEGEVPDRDKIDAEIAAAKKKGKASAKAALPHADIAPTGRARCLSCGEPLAKGSLRVAVEREVDGPMGPMRSAGYLHTGCALAYAEEQGGEDPEGFVEQVFANSTHLADEHREQLQTELGAD